MVNTTNTWLYLWICSTGPFIWYIRRGSCQISAFTLANSCCITVFDDHWRLLCFLLYAWTVLVDNSQPQHEISPLDVAKSYTLYIQVITINGAKNSRRHRLTDHLWPERLLVSANLFFWLTFYYLIRVDLVTCLIIGKEYML